MGSAAHINILLLDDQGARPCVPQAALLKNQASAVVDKVRP
jgi:hypothetical protein